MTSPTVLGMSPWLNGSAPSSSSSVADSSAVSNESSPSPSANRDVSAWNSSGLFARRRNFRTVSSASALRVSTTMQLRSYVHEIAMIACGSGGQPAVDDEDLPGDEGVGRIGQELGNPRDV